MCTGQLLPVSINPNERYVNYTPYWSDTAILQPPKVRSANMQVYALEKLSRQLTKLSGIPVIPSFAKHRQISCTSLAKMGFHPLVAGISKRPNLPQAEETMCHVNSNLQKAIPINSLNLPIDRPNCQPCVVHEELLEISPRSRFNAAATLRKQNIKASRR